MLIPNCTGHWKGEGTQSGSILMDDFQEFLIAINCVKSLNNGLDFMNGFETYSLLKFSSSYYHKAMILGEGIPL